MATQIRAIDFTAQKARGFEPLDVHRHGGLRHAEDASQFGGMRVRSQSGFELESRDLRPVLRGTMPPRHLTGSGHSRWQILLTNGIKLPYEATIQEIPLRRPTDYASAARRRALCGLPWVVSGSEGWVARCAGSEL